MYDIIYKLRIEKTDSTNWKQVLLEKLKIKKTDDYEVKSSEYLKIFFWGRRCHRN